MAALVTEMIGTLFLVLAILLAVLGPGDVPVAAAVGLVLLATVYAGGPVSRAMYNPAVSVGFAARGVLDRRTLWRSVLAQLLGAGVALGLTVAMIGVPTGAPRGQQLPAALVAEFVFTFALMWVILHVADLHEARGNPWYGLAIASVVATAILVVGPVSGAVLNPAVTIALWLADLLTLRDAAAYIPIQVAGAMLAVVVASVTAGPMVTTPEAPAEGPKG